MSIRLSQEKGWLLAGFEGVWGISGATSEVASFEGSAGVDWLFGTFSAGFGEFWLGVGSDGAKDFAGDSGASGELTEVADFDAAGAGGGVGAVLRAFSGLLVARVGLTAGVAG